MPRLAERIRMRQDPDCLVSEETNPITHTPPPSPAAVYLASLAPGSRPTKQQALALVSRALGYPDPLTCPWHRLTYAHTAALRARLVERAAPATANKILSAVRRVLVEARRLGLMSADACAAACDIAPVRGNSAPRGRMLEQTELAALLRACARDATPRGRRDAALIAVGVAGGLRRAELVALDQADVAGDGATHVRRGKGAKDRTVYLAGDALRLLVVWQAARATAPGPALFVAISRTGRVLADRRLTPAAVRSILLARCAQAGITPATPHDLRRTAISRLLDSGVDLATAARVAGHASVQTTAAYDRRGERALRAAGETLGDLGEGTL